MGRSGHGSGGDVAVGSSRSLVVLGPKDGWSRSHSPRDDSPHNGVRARFYSLQVTWSGETIVSALDF